MFELFEQSAFKTSKEITNLYSTSFGKGIEALDKKLRNPIYGIYGFVRYTDEIVDTFFKFDQRLLLDEFVEETYKAIDRKISLNPVLHAFQSVVNEYDIERELIDAFIASMKMDLDKIKYNQFFYSEYIYGSAEVVGLMCLKVFTERNVELYNQLQPFAKSLGAAFQKINFLRDIQSDFEDRGRVYFPGVDFSAFSSEKKKEIEADIQNDFDLAYKGILLLPKSSRGGVYLAYAYYLALFSKIKKVAAARILNERIRVPDSEKIVLMTKTYFRNKFNLI
ncbi:MAG: phytoene/squalene synthase family protein [Chitinophagales bacterium]|nr:phytoene/squalene synthase family protein [Chitinophagales bacterium]